MKDLLIFEFKKIVRKKLNIIVVLASFALTALLFISPVIQFISFDKDGNQERGFTAIELEKSNQKELAGVLTEDRIKDDILKYQQLFDNPDNIVINDGKKELSDSAFNKYLVDKMYYLGLLNNNYTIPNLYDYSFAELKKLQIEEDAKFYSQRDNKIYKLLNASYEDWNYSEQEKEFWIEKNKEVSTPFEYGYHEGWKTVFNCIELMALPIIAICICIAPVFAGEYQSGADNIILSSRYGKSKLILSKVLASFVCNYSIYIKYCSRYRDYIIIIRNRWVEFANTNYKFNNTIFFNIFIGNSYLYCNTIFSDAFNGINYIIIICKNEDTIFSVNCYDMYNNGSVIL